MADQDEPSLELPSIRLRRRRSVGVDEPPPVADEARERPVRQLRLPGQLTAVLTGLVVGLTAIGLVWLGERGCEAISGTSSCGGGAGVLALVVVVIALTLLGAGLLRLLGVARPGSTSTLAVGFATVVVLLVFADVLLERTGAVVVVLAAVAAYVVAQAVTSAAGD